MTSHRKFNTVNSIPVNLQSDYGNLRFKDWIEKPESFSDNRFKFLNLSKPIDSPDIDWSFSGFGKLWNYNLNYMDYLLQPTMGKEQGLMLINLFINSLNKNNHGLDPYPISLRGINWIKFIIKHNIQDQEIDNSLYAQYKILAENLEYHLLGNHLLENSFSLLFGAFYFNDVKLYEKARGIVESQLNEQLLNDGGHFELSPMYHQIILDRLLDCINLLQNNKLFDQQESLLALLEKQSIRMVQWLNNMTFSNGNIPLFNDSAESIAPTTSQLIDYAAALNLAVYKSGYSALQNSGYRRLDGSDFECIIDVGRPGPDYQPGHAHADTFNFELYLNGKPIVVDTGISTYEKNERRLLERGTSSHNTVQIEDFNSSEVWGGFRMAQRAGIISLEENSTGLTAIHDGYKHLGLLHARTISRSEKELQITDQISGKKQVKSVARIHLHPDVKFQMIDNMIYIDGMTIEFSGDPPFHYRIISMLRNSIC